MLSEMCTTAQSGAKRGAARWRKRRALGIENIFIFKIDWQNESIYANSAHSDHLRTLCARSSVHQQRLVIQAFTQLANVAEWSRRAAAILSLLSLWQTTAWGNPRAFESRRLRTSFFIFWGGGEANGVWGRSGAFSERPGVVDRFFLHNCLAALSLKDHCSLSSRASVCTSTE